MDEDEGGGGGGMLEKKRIGAGEVDFKNKSGTAWSHSYLNQKPWHPLSYPNQRRKWIAEQTTAQRERRAEEVAREFAQEQEFFRQTAMISKKEKEKIEMMKAVSFMYVRPPGYNAESARAAELEDERKVSGQSDPPQPQLPQEPSLHEKKKSRPKDVFGRTLPTEEEFEVLKNAPRLETGLPARSKPFGVEVRNVKCARCGAFGHQSGDRECPLKDAIMPNEQSRLQRDDPLTSILAHTDSIEPLKWELKQKPGISPPRGGFKPDDPNQQIVAEDIFDEYGGFLSGDGIGIPELLTNFTLNKSRKHSKSKTKKRDSLSLFDDDVDREKKKKKKEKIKRKKHKKHKHSDSSDNSDFDRYRESKKRLPVFSSFDDSNKYRSLSDAERSEGSKKKKVKGEKHKKQRHSDSSEDSDLNRHHQSRSHRSISISDDNSDDDRWLPDTEIEKRWKKEQTQREKHKRRHSDDSDEDHLSSDSERERRKKKEKVKREKHKSRHSVSSDNEEFDKHRESRRHSRLSSPYNSDPDGDHKRNKHRACHYHNHDHYHHHSRR